MDNGRIIHNNVRVKDEPVDEKPRPIKEETKTVTLHTHSNAVPSTSRLPTAPASVGPQSVTYAVGFEEVEHRLGIRLSSRLPSSGDIFPSYEAFRIQVSFATHHRGDRILIHQYPGSSNGYYVQMRCNQSTKSECQSRVSCTAVDKKTGKGAWRVIAGIWEHNHEPSLELAKRTWNPPHVTPPAENRKRSRNPTQTVETKTDGGDLPPKIPLPIAEDLRRRIETTFQITLSPSVPRVGDVFPTRLSLQFAYSYAMALSGHTGGVFQSPQASNRFGLGVGCSKTSLARSSPAYCPCRTFAAPENRLTGEGKWTVTSVEGSHTHEPTVLTFWKPPKLLVTRRPRGARAREVDSEDESFNGMQTESEGEEWQEEVDELDEENMDVEMDDSRRSSLGSARRRQRDDSHSSADVPLASTSNVTGVHSVKPRIESPTSIPPYISRPSASTSATRLPASLSHGPKASLSSFSAHGTSRIREIQRPPAPLPSQSHSLPTPPPHPHAPASSSSFRLVSVPVLGSILGTISPLLTKYAPVLHAAGLDNSESLVRLWEMNEEEFDSVFLRAAEDESKRGVRMPELMRGYLNRAIMTAK